MDTKHDDDRTGQATAAPLPIIEDSAPAIEAMDYETVSAALGEARARVTALTARKDALEEAYARGAHYKDVLALKKTFKSDDGVLLARLSGHRVINATDPKVDLLKAHAPSVRVNGITYQHVEDTPTGEWIYRSDN